MGSILHGENNNENKIGEGAFGEVYKKNEKYLIAEKRIKKESITRLLQISWEEAKNKVLGEISILSNCHSRNIVQIYDYKINEDTIAIQMEYCDKTLFQYKEEKGGKLSLSEIKEIFFQLNNALKYLSEKNIIHRDLKLENVLIKTKDNINIVKLGDFGLSKYIHENEINSTNCGTPAYMAPEIQSGRYTTKSDIWSVGVMIYLLRFGEMPRFIDTYKLDHNEKFSEEDDVLLNLLNKIFEEPTKRISWNEYFSHEFFRTEEQVNLNQKKIFKSILDCKNEITSMLILNNNDLCVSSKNLILIFNSNDFCLKNQFPIYKNYIINHLLSLEDNSIGASLDDGNFYIIKLTNDNCHHIEGQILITKKKKNAITIKLLDESGILVSGCESEIIFWKKNNNNEYKKYKGLKYEGNATSLIEYPKKYLIATLNFTESIKIYSLDKYEEVKTFDDIVCSGYELCSVFLDNKTLVIIGELFYIFDLEKLELIKTVKYDGHYINSIINYGDKFLLGVTKKGDNEDIYELHQVYFDEKSKKFIRIAYQCIHNGAIVSILLKNDYIITGSLDKSIIILK